MKKEQSRGNMKNILLIGDWVLEEHWVTGIHRSPTASRTGQAHYRALNELTSSTIAFCAAAQVAAVLSKCNDREFCNVKGIGFWNKDNTEILTSYFGANGTSGITPHIILNSNRNNKESNVELLDCCKDNNLGTTRVIRIYQQSGSKVELLRRIDWELPDITKYPNINNFIKKVKQDIRNIEEIDAIVIKDVNKGVVTPELIKSLTMHEKLRNVPWFVSTKNYLPAWFEYLKNVKLKLLIVPQVAAQTAIREKQYNIHCWITRNGYASREALEQIDEIAKEVRTNEDIKNHKYPFIIVLPQGLSLLTKYYDKSKGEDTGLIQSTIEPQPFSVGVHMASVLFSALVAYMLKNEVDSSNINDVIEYCLSFTQAWRREEASRIVDTRKIPDVELSFYTDMAKRNKKLEDLEKSRKTVEVRKTLEWKLFPWVHAKKEWEEAFSKNTFGVVTRTDQKECLQLWRAMVELDGYICRVERKRKDLQVIIEHLNSFKSTKQTKSFMLISPPGSGKTSLVSSLAKTAGFRFLQFNITQMLRKEDIFNCFDTIATTQFQNKEEAVLVFFDEINANLESQYVYDTFLAPLEDNVYVRAGKTFYLDPCVWIFAGTEKPSKLKDKNREKSIKASDFESRLTIPPIDLSYTKKIMNEAKIENIYLGVSLLRTIFSDVNVVSKNVLEIFYALPPEIEVRGMKKFIGAFQNIQYGKVKGENVREETLDILKVLLKDVLKKSEIKKVVVETKELKKEKTDAVEIEC